MRRENATIPSVRHQHMHAAHMQELTATVLSKEKGMTR